MPTTHAKMQQRRDTAANWTSSNPILAAGEIGFEIDTLFIKIGNGITQWNSLTYAPGSVNPGTTPSNGLAGSIPFLTGTTVSQDNNRLFWDSTNHTLKIGDKDYTPSLTLPGIAPTIALTVGTATAISNSGHYVGESHEFTVDQSGDSKFVLGEFHKLRVSGTYTNSNVYGIMYTVDNRTSFQSGTGWVVGMNIFMNCESATQNCFGLTVSAGSGGAGASPISNLVGIQGGCVAGHNAHQDNATAIWADWTSVDGGFGAGVQTTTLGKILWVQAQHRDNNTVTQFRGISISDWTLGFSTTVGTSYGIYIDNTIDIGATKYAIYSQSVSQSRFLGALSVPDEPFDSVTWQNSGNVPTRGDLYTLISSQILTDAPQSSFDYKKVLIHHHDMEDITGFPNGGFTVAAGVSGTYNGTTVDFSAYPDAIGVAIITLSALSSTYGASISEKSIVNSTKSEFSSFGRGTAKARYKFGFLALSDGTQTYTVTAGFSNGFTSTAPTRGCFFRYAHSVNGGKWQAVCLNGSGETAIDTGITVSTGLMHAHEVVVNEDGTSVDFYWDDTHVGNITTNIPANTDGLGACFQMLRSAGTGARDIMIIDYSHSEWSLIGRRY